MTHSAPSCDGSLGEAAAEVYVYAGSTSTSILFGSDPCSRIVGIGLAAAVAGAEAALIADVGACRER